jgi:hypothetical protein
MQLSGYTSQDFKDCCKAMDKSELIREVHDRNNNKLAMKEMDLR